MKDDIELCNVALTMLNERPITGFNQSTSTEKTLERLYNYSLKTVLNAYDWSEATKRFICSELGTKPAFGFKYELGLPPDFVRLISVYSDNAATNQLNGAEYSVEGNKILSNTNALYIKYVGVPEISKCSQSFIDAVVHRLCANIAYKITATASQANYHEQIYQDILNEAKRNDANQSQMGLGDYNYMW